MYEGMIAWPELRSLPAGTIWRPAVEQNCTHAHKRMPASRCLVLLLLLLLWLLLAVVIDCESLQIPHSVLHAL